MYPRERIDEIVDQFSQLLKSADNSGTLTIQKNNLSDEQYSASLKDARKYWIGLRREGANLLGVTRHLLSELAIAEKTIGEYQRVEQAQDERVEKILAQEWEDFGECYE
jgi:hypothetical protein